MTCKSVHIHRLLHPDWEGTDWGTVIGNGLKTPCLGHWTLLPACMLHRTETEMSFVICHEHMVHTTTHWVGDSNAFKSIKGINKDSSWIISTVTMRCSAGETSLVRLSGQCSHCLRGSIFKSQEIEEGVDNKGLKSWRVQLRFSVGHWRKNKDTPKERKLQILRFRKVVWSF